MLGLGRALGETVAVVLIIVQLQDQCHVLETGTSTISSLIANNFGETTKRSCRAVGGRIRPLRHDAGRQHHRCHFRRPKSRSGAAKRSDEPRRLHHDGGSPSYSADATAESVDDDDVPRPLGKVNSDDVFAGIGSFIGSFALIWLLYFEILPLNGLIGFVVCWWIGFLAMYGGVTALSHPRTVVIDRVMGAVVTGTAVLIGFVLVTVISYTIWRGHLALDHANFYLQNGSQGSLTGPLNKGGIKNDIVGSVIQVGIAVAMSAAARHRNRRVHDRGRGLVRPGGQDGRRGHDRGSRSARRPVHLHRSHHRASRPPQWPRGRARRCQSPERRSSPGRRRSRYESVPGGLREAGLALGSSQWQTVRRIVLPTARPGLATALILAVARMIGERAPDHRLWIFALLG